MKKFLLVVKDLFSGSRTPDEQKPERRQAPSNDDILMDHYKEALHDAAQGLPKEESIKKAHLKTDDRIHQTQQTHTESISKHEEQIAEDTALYDDITKNKEEYVEREVEKLPASELKEVSKLEVKVLSQEELIKDLTLENALLNTNKAQTPTIEGIKAWMLLAFTLTIFGSDLVVSQSIVEYAMNSVRLAGWVIAPAISLFTALMPHFLAIALHRNGKLMFALAILLSLALFGFMFIGQIELGRGVFGTCLIIILFVASSLFNIEYLNQQKANAETKRKAFIQKLLPRLKVGLVSLKKELNAKKEALHKAAKLSVDEEENEVKNRLLNLTKERDGIQRELQSETKRLTDLKVLIDSKIEEAYATFNN